MVPTQLSTVEQPHLLLVEGQDDGRLFSKLCRELGCGSLTIRGLTGKSNLRSTLNALRSTDGFADLKTLGIVRDADDNPAGALQSVRQALSNAGLAAPATAMTLEPGSPSVAVLILPGGGGHGELEDICLETVRQTPEMRCVDAYLRCLQAGGTALGKLAKARAYAFIAAKPKPSLRLGEAIDAGYFPWDHDGFREARELIRLLTATAGV